MKTHLTHMSEIENAIATGYAIIIYPNALGTATLALVDGEDWAAVESVIENLPDEQIIDVTRPTGPEAIDVGVARIGRKIRREGEYANWDEKMRALGLPNPSERPQNRDNN